MSQNALTSPIVSFSIEHKGQTRNVVARWLKKRKVEAPLTLGEANADDLRYQLRETLEDFVELIDTDLEINVADASAALQRVNGMAMNIAWELFSQRNVYNIQDLLHEAFPGWPRHDQHGIIAVDAGLERLAPFDLLPLFDLKTWDDVTTREDLDLAARRFLGFSVVTQRGFVNTVYRPKTLKGRKRLPIKHLHNTELDALFEESVKVVSEPEMFREKEDVIDSDGPWPPDDLPQDDLRSALVRHLRNPQQMFNGKTRNPPDQIWHFSCHCRSGGPEFGDTRRKPTLNSTIEFSNGRAISIGELQQGIMDICRQEHEQQRATPTLPLVFLNACGSSMMSPSAVTSFPRFFLVDNQNPGFIGTEMDIPNRFAALFAASFYQKFLGGTSLGKSILESRRELLHDYGNPLGLLYTVYADPDTKVSRGFRFFS